MTAGAENQAVLDQLREFAESERDGTDIKSTLIVGPFTAYTLIGAVQLACRHPEMSAAQRAILRGLAAQMEPLFGGPVADSIRRGWEGE